MYIRLTIGYYLSKSKEGDGVVVSGLDFDSCRVSSHFLNGVAPIAISLSGLTGLKTDSNAKCDFLFSTSVGVVLRSIIRFL